MTTIINPGNTENTDSGAGWAVAVIVLLAVVGVGAYFWFNYYRVPPTTDGTTNINVTIPNPIPSTTP